MQRLFKDLHLRVFADPKKLETRFFVFHQKPFTVKLIVEPPTVDDLTGQLRGAELLS